MPARILLIEDNPVNLELARYLLCAFGHSVTTAETGEQGLALAGSDAYDLLICDIQLPGIDGYEVARRLKGDARLAAIPLIAVTAFAMVGDREKVFAGGFDGYIPKPLDPEKFVGQVDQHLPPTLRSRAPGTPDGGTTGHRNQEGADGHDPRR